MTLYTVVWDLELEATYLETWLASNSEKRAVLSECANWLDRELEQNAELKGQLVSEGPERVIDVVLTSTTEMVRAVFEVQVEDRMVRVLRLAFRRT